VVDGEPSIVKDGRATSLGIFGGGLEEAVADNPRALEHAETFSDYSIASFILGIFGAGASGGGVGLIVGNEAGNRDSGLRAAGMALAFGGLAVSLVGAAFQVAAQPHFYDAINIYNDEVGPGYQPTPVPLHGPYPPGSPAAMPAGPPRGPVRPPGGSTTGAPPSAVPPPLQPPPPVQAPPAPTPSDSPPPEPTSPDPEPNPAPNPTPSPTP
jgi:hypothetical protein